MITVVVIARAGADLSECLAALRAAGATAPYVAQLEVPGAWATARNAALAACTDELIVYVEDDVLVAPGWLDALTATWTAGGPALACVGGPLRAGAGARPRWLSDALAPAFALGDPGGEARDVDPATTTFHGGNVSFRAPALRGIGGFAPLRGGARDWFGDEHEAQRALALAGWRCAYAPDAAAERVIPATTRPREAVLARLRYGGRSVIAGAPPPHSPAAVGWPGRGSARRAAARAAAAASAGTLLAQARGDRTLAIERAARAAQAAGVLIGARAAAGSLDPAAPSTPFRPTVPGAARASVSPTYRWVKRTFVRAPRRGGAAILLYHRVCALDRDPFGLAVDPARFADQIATLARRHEIVALADVAAGRAPDGAVAITFDDGYADNLAHALGVLRAHGAAATIFVSTGHVALGVGFWWDTLDRVLSASAGRALRLALPGGERAWPPGSPAAREHLNAWLQALTPEAVAAVLTAIDAGATAAPPDRDRPLTPAELRELAAEPLIALGAHGRSHPSLARTDPARRDDELRGSALDLRALTGVRPSAFAYPYGVPGVDVDAQTIAAARAAGYAYAVVNAPGLATAATDRRALPRIAARDEAGAALAARLCAVLR